jgi:hypothetical protein
VDVIHPLVITLLVVVGQGTTDGLPFDMKAPERVTIAARLEPSRSGNAPTLVIEATPRPGIHVYAPGNPSYIPVSVHVDETAGVRPGKAIFPPGEPYVFGQPEEIVRVYSRPFTIRQPLTAPAGAPPPAVITGRVRYQACDNRICFPPIDAPFTATGAAGSGRAPASRGSGGASSSR